MFLEGRISSTEATFPGSTSIPFCVTQNPRYLMREEAKWYFFSVCFKFEKQVFQKQLEDLKYVFQKFLIK